MARKKGNGANKSALIREAMEQGISSPRDIAAHLKEQHGIEVTPAYVSTIKSNMKRKGTGASRTKSPRVRKAAAAMSESGLTSGIEFVRSVGGIENARRTLDLLEQIKQL